MAETTPRQARRADTPQPAGYTSPIPSPLARAEARGGDRVQLTYMAERLAEIRLGGDVIAAEEGLPAEVRTLGGQIGSEAGALHRMAKALAAGALALAVLGGALLAPGATSGAQAMAYPSKTRTAALIEGPEPDPIARVVAPAAVSVVLGAAGATARIRVTTPHVTPRGYHCASVWGPASFLGRACSRYATFTVPVTLSRYAPLGRSILAVTDDVSPMDVQPARVALDVRRTSQFGPGVWRPTQYGDGLTVYATLCAYTSAVGRCTPQQNSPVRIQERIRGDWVTLTTVWTNSRGVFLGTVILGGGIHTVRVARPQGATVTATTGTARTFLLVPTDVPDGIV